MATYSKTISSPIEVSVDFADIYGIDACGDISGESPEAWTVGAEEVGFTGLIYGENGILDMASTPSSYGRPAVPDDTPFQISMPNGFEPYAIQSYCYWSESGWQYGGQYEYNDDNALFTIGESVPATEVDLTPIVDAMGIIAGAFIFLLSMSIIMFYFRKK